jgi:regulatory protein
MKQLKEAAGAMSAKMRAVRIVAASSVSKKDLQRRLVAKGEDPTQAQAAVQRMADLELVDDKKVAEQIVSRCISKGYGLARAKQALYEKQIPKAYWDEVLADYPDQIEEIMQFLRDHLGEQPEQKDKMRVINALIRRGHSYGIIRRAMERLSYDADDIPEE